MVLEAAGTMRQAHANQQIRPMLGIAGLGIAFRAKPLVKAEAKQAISTLGLDAILYLMGFRDREISS